VTGWGAEQLTREELLNLGAKLHSAWDASVQQANRSPGAGQMRRFFAVGAEMCWLWGEAADELIARDELVARRPGRAAQAPGVVAAREPEAGL
jgi:hypothetical protein